MTDFSLAKEISKVAEIYEIEPAALMAVIEVESGGRLGAKVNGKMEPLIRFEGHYFYKLLPRIKRNQAVVSGLASPRAGKVRNPIRQAGRWQLLARASKIDRTAAYASCSWGCGQVMGAHWRWLGYASIDALVAEARNGAIGQVHLMMRFIKKSGLIDVLNAQDWAGFARRYNGPKYKKYGYDRKLLAAYHRHRKGSGNSAPVRSKPLRHELFLLREGSQGEAVFELQSKLKSLGFFLDVDGDFGPATKRMAKQFQKENRLKADGVVGPKTQEMLQRKMPVAA